MSLHDEAVRKVTGSIYAAAWRQITPDEATKQIMDHLNPTLWPRRTPGYGTTGTRRIKAGRRQFPALRRP